nr:hypothetical protein GCM10020063_029350 [Dactylosporangium thailandense]
MLADRRTARSALLSAWPQPRKPLPPRPAKLDEFKPVIDGILLADLEAPRKQWHTMKRIYDRLIAEHDMLDVSYAVVRAYVADDTRHRGACPCRHMAMTRADQTGIDRPVDGRKPRLR